MMKKALRERKKFCAWYTLTVAHIEHASMPVDMAKRLPHYPLPVFVLAQLAVDRKCQGQGLGDITLINALRRCAHLSQRGKVPSVAVVVDVLNDAAMGFTVATPISGRCIWPPNISDPGYSFR